jgi:hypothetical protein
MAADTRSTKALKISVLLAPEEAERFSAYCQERGFKKSTLITRLIREHLDRERYWLQQNLFGKNYRRANEKDD